MVYLSRLTVSQNVRKSRGDWTFPAEMQRTLARAFGNYMEGIEDSRLLYRIDASPRLHALVQTRYRPDWTRLSVPSEYLAAPPEVKEIHPSFHTGDRFIFRLRANPTLRSSGRRFGLYTYDQQVDWLSRKSSQNGFRVEKLALKQDDCMEVRGADGRVAKCVSVQYDGELSVTNPILFLDAFENGLGSARVMGCGLLSLARC